MAEFKKIIRAKVATVIGVDGRGYQFDKGEVQEVDFGSEQNFNNMQAPDIFELALKEDLGKPEIAIIEPPLEDLSNLNIKNVDTNLCMVEEGEKKEEEEITSSAEVEIPSNANKVSVCSICGREFKSIRGLKMHISRAHKGE